MLVMRSSIARRAHHCSPRWARFHLRVLRHRRIVSRFAHPTQRACSKHCQFKLSTTEQTRPRVLAANNARVMRQHVRPRNSRGRREDRVSADTHDPRAAKKARGRITGSAKYPAFPAQWCYDLLRALPGERLDCPRRPQDASTSHELSASTAAPEPHDLAVRVNAVRQRHQCVHRSPPPRS
jgi:hypothetical protein